MFKFFGLCVGGGLRGAHVCIWGRLLSGVQRFSTPVWVWDMRFSLHAVYGPI
jgi:hypothetical protein